jgi:hypothetical protein
MLLFVAVNIRSRAETAEIQTLSVESVWGGWGKPAHSEFWVHWRGDSYIAKGRTVPNGLLNALLTAMEEAQRSVPMAANLGVTTQWLHHNADQAGAHASRLFYRDGLPEQKAVFREAFEDQRTIPSSIKHV